MPSPQPAPEPWLAASRPPATVADLVTFVTPHARAALLAAGPTLAAKAGRLAWLAAWPAWKLVTGPLLPVLIRIGVELAVLLTAPQALPFLDLVLRLIPFVDRGLIDQPHRDFAADLRAVLATPVAAMCDPVRELAASGAIPVVPAPAPVVPGPTPTPAPGPGWGGPPPEVVSVPRAAAVAADSLLSWLWHRYVPAEVRAREQAEYDLAIAGLRNAYDPRPARGD